MNQMGIKNLINRNAPAGEQVAFINEREADLLRRSGGSGRTDNNPYGIPSYVGGGEPDDYGGDSGDTSGFGGEGDSFGGDSPDLDYGRPTGSVPANSVNPTGRTTDQIVFDDNYGKIGSFGNLHQDLNPQGREGLYGGSSSSGGQGFFGTIGNFLKDTVKQAFNNPGTFLMNTAVNLNPVGALANIVSGLATGKSIGTNISNTVGGQNVQASPFNQALGDVGQDIRGVFSNFPDNLNIQDFLSQREPTLFSPEQARQLNAAASRIPNIGDPLVATGKPINLSPEPVSDPYTSASSIGVQQVGLPNLTPSGSKVAPAPNQRFTSTQSGNPQQYLDAVNKSTINQSRTANPALFDKNISDQRQALSQIDLMYGGPKQFADALSKSRGS